MAKFAIRKQWPERFKTAGGEEVTLVLRPLSRIDKVEVRVDGICKNCLRQTPPAEK